MSGLKLGHSEKSCRRLTNQATCHSGLRSIVPSCSIYEHPLLILPGDIGTAVASAWLAYILQNVPSVDEDFVLPHDVDAQINIDGPGAPAVFVEEVPSGTGFFTAYRAQVCRSKDEDALHVLCTID